jgi:hypothetical protein
MNLIRLWGLLYPMLRWLLLAMLILLFAQALPFDVMAVLFAGDVVTYLEIAGAIWLAAQATRLRWAAIYARFVVQRIVRRARIRARRGARRIARLRPPPSDGDRPAPAFAYV